MGHGRTLTRGARAYGAAVCSLLALISLSWIVRDLSVAAEPTDVWWLWAGLPARPESGIWATSLTDPVLFCVYAVAGVLSLRSPSAAGALAAAGALTVALRLPSLWNLHAGWLRMIDSDLRTRAALGAWAAVLLGATLLAVAVAGRGAPADRAAARPGRSVSVTACLLLGASAAAGAWTQIHAAREWGWEAYGKQLTGGPQNFYALLQAPAGWSAWAAVLLALVAGTAALAPALFARPLGMTAAALLTALGAASVTADERMGIFDHFAVMPFAERLGAVTGLLHLLAGLAVLAVLAPPTTETPAPRPARVLWHSAAEGYGESGRKGPAEDGAVRSPR